VVLSAIPLTLHGFGWFPAGWMSKNLAIAQAEQRRLDMRIAAEGRRERTALGATTGEYL
jgi:hypothetical protein